MAGVLSIRFACAPPRGKESNNHGKNPVPICRARRHRAIAGADGSSQHRDRHFQLDRRYRRYAADQFRLGRRLHALPSRQSASCRRCAASDTSLLDRCGHIVQANERMARRRRVRRRTAGSGRRRDLRANAQPPARSRRASGTRRRKPAAGFRQPRPDLLSAGRGNRRRTGRPPARPPREPGKHPPRVDWAEVRPLLPTQDQHAHRRDHQHRSADPLAAPGAWPALARRLPAGHRRACADGRRRRMGD